jgi:transcriptional regulator with XRE-family HTH domain
MDLSIGAMPPRPLEVGPAGIQAARTIEILRTERGLSQRQLAGRVTALGHPMSNTTLCRIERAQRRCDADDLVAIAEALLVSPLVLLQRPTTT